tara:strand:+ start:190 stop:639 length:450 start_codon:yes stop_codon:yes gene_type:complete
MDFLLFINLVSPAQWMILSVLILAVSIMFLGDNFLPLISVSTILVAFVDYIGFGMAAQLIIFSSSLIILMMISPKLLNSNTKLLIAEDTIQMVGQSIRLTAIDLKNDARGQAIAKNGKIWNVIHQNSNKLVVNKSYECVSIEGINLIVK